jgi:hypothetical protein
VTAARTTRRKAIRLGRRSSLGDDPVRPLRLTLGPQQPPANASTPLPLIQLSCDALLPVAATQSCSPSASSRRPLLPPNPHRPCCTAADH